VTKAKFDVGRRDFLIRAGLASAAEICPRPLRALTAPAQQNEKLIGIQISAISFTDEGIDRVLDILQEKAGVNTLFLSAFTYDRGTGGRQVPGRPLPDHGKKEYDDFHGGDFATPHLKFYGDTAFRDIKAPDLGDTDILADVLPKTQKRGMKVYAWDYNIFRKDTPHVQDMEEEDIFGNKLATCCAYNPQYQHFVVDLIRDHCSSYSIDGVMWGAEQQGPFNNIIGANTWNHPGSCFCEWHRKAAAARGIDVPRAIEGYKKLVAFVQQSEANQRPTDGYFVEFWRIMVDYPEILAWEKLWTDGKYGTYRDIYRTAKSVRPELQVGFHIWHTASFSPFFRAEQDFLRFTEYADFLKPVLYNNSAGPRYVTYLERLHKTIFHDMSGDEILQMHNDFLNYHDLGPDMTMKALPVKGMPAEYVYRETKRALDDVQGKCKIYPGIDIDIPTTKGEKETTPEDTYAATAAALRAGAQGLVLSRKYSEMRLANLAGAGKAVREAGTSKS
jgi:hypothetical protein